MRILFLTNNPNLGSTARALQDWILLGRKEGVEACVGAQSTGDFTKWLETEGVPYIVDLMPWPDRWRPLPSLWHAAKLAWWARCQHIDIIYCNEHNVYPFAVLLRFLLNRPLVCHVNYWISREFAAWAFGGPRREPDALLWTSRQQQEDCRDAIDQVVENQRQHVVPLGIDVDRFGTMGHTRDRIRQEWSAEPDSIVIGTASALRPRKKIEDFLDIAISLARKDPRIIGVLAGDAPKGDEPYRQKILEQIRNSDMEGHLRWLGHLEPIEPFMHAIDIFVSTSNYETFGMSVCEAMVCQRPVAAYRGGSVHEVLGDEEMIVQTGDRDGLEAIVERLVRNPQLRAELGQRNRQRVEDEFNPAKSLEQLKEIYASLLPGGSHSK